MSAILDIIRVGDRVRITRAGSVYHGRIGEVVEIQPWGKEAVLLIVDFGDGRRRTVFASGVERVL